MSGMRVSISGVGKALPKRVVTNAEIASRLGVDSDWIESRTGIRERRFAARSESTSTLAIAAGRQALESARTTGERLDLILVATCTPDHLFPPTAAIVQKALGAEGAGAMDVNGACSGFIYSLALAGGLLGAGTHERILIVGADVLSHHINLDDPVTAPLFGDGAGAVVLERSDSGEPMEIELGADGEGAQHVIIPAGGSGIPTSAQTLDRGLHWIRMAGREVYRSAVRMMSSLGEHLGNSGFELLIAHQANRRILVECAEQLGVPSEKLFINIDRYGNTSAASIPIAICEAWETGRLTPGVRLLLLAFGAGYTWAGAKLRWNLPSPAASDSSHDSDRIETSLSGVPR